MSDLKRFKKDHSIDGWPIRDNETQRILHTDDLVFILNEFDKMKKDINKIKAEAVREFIERFKDTEETSQIMYDWLNRESMKYKNKLEQGEK